MDISSYIEPTELNAIKGNLSAGLTLGDIVKPNLNHSVDYDIAIIGVPNDTNGTNNKGSAKSVETIRKELYALRGNFKNSYIADLGNIISKTAKEAYFALEEIIPYLLSQRVIPIIIGGSQDFSLPLFKGLNEVIPKPNLVCIDQTLDANHSDDFDHQNYLKPILNSKLKSFTIIGFQPYLYDETFLKQYHKMPQNCVRMSEVRKKLHACEPLLRDADMVSIDMNVVRLSDAPGNKLGSPNGLFSDELCQLARYAGFSDRVSLFSLFETNPGCDINNQTSKLAALAIWHFLDGLEKRYKDYPVRDIGSYSKLIVQASSLAEKMVFYNNPVNNRWWIEIDADSELIVSCNIDDYHTAKAGKVPEIYYKWRR